MAIVKITDCYLEECLMASWLGLDENDFISGNVSFFGAVGTGFWLFQERNWAEGFFFFKERVDAKLEPDISLFSLLGVSQFPFQKHRVVMFNQMTSHLNWCHIFESWCHIPYEMLADQCPFMTHETGILKWNTTHRSCWERHWMHTSNTLSELDIKLIVPG